MRQRAKYLSAALLLFACLHANAQLKKPTTTAADAQGATLVYLEQCATLSFDEQRLPDAQLLKGNVRFRHDNALMYCDSAYFYEGQNAFEAFSNIRIIQADTIFIYGDRLSYDGNSRLARMRGNVRLENRNAVLTTDSLNYDRNRNIAYYFTGGTINDDLNTLTSVWGQYQPNLNEATFKTDVRLNNPNFVMASDTLHYNTATHIAQMVGPTDVTYRKETVIHSQLGYYNTENERSILYRRSTIEHADGHTLTGDTIYYDKRRQYGEVHAHMELTDSTHKTTLYGNYGTFDQAASAGMATDSALMVDWSTEDSIFVHADTLYTNRLYVDSAQLAERIRIRRLQKYGADTASTIADTTVNAETFTPKPPKDIVNAPQAVVGAENSDSQVDTAITAVGTPLQPTTQNGNTSLREQVRTARELQSPTDTVEVDSTYHLLRGFHNVRVYRRDMQAVSDSISYSTIDSVMHLYHFPILWNENNQIAGDQADIYTRNNTVDYAVMSNNAIAIQQVDSVHYNQMAGKEIIAHVVEKQVRVIDVNGNAETRFYPIDDKDSSIIGMNITLSSFIKIYVKDRKIERAVLTNASNGTMFPLEQTTEENRYLSNFFWAEAERPKSPEDVFSRPPATPRKKQHVSASSDNSSSKTKKGRKGRNDKTDTQTESTDR
ncbi:MAG: hypothetical protein IJ680_09595 [Paludibacteraceae bacterium]|nr:hypothetical protein [Paludibacteraceae bacterium]